MNAQPDRKIFTVREYHKMIDAGVFIGNSNYELIEGEIVKKMVVGNYHISCVNRLNMFFAVKLAGKAIVSVQNPVILDDLSEPEPDVTIFRYREDFYASAKATAADVLLLIEVSDSTVNYDRTKKVRLYAEAGVAEVWLVNLPRQIIEVYGNPEKGKYKIVRKITKSESLAPAFAPELQIKVTDILG